MSLQERYESYEDGPCFDQAVEYITTPTIKGVLQRNRLINTSNLFHLARRDAEILVVEIKSCGAWGRLTLFDGNYRELWHMPSVFTGSFKLNGFCENGIYLHSNSGPGVAPLLSVSWRERDQMLV